MFYDANIGKDGEKWRTWFMGRDQRKSPAILTDGRAGPKLTFLN